MRRSVQVGIIDPAKVIRAALKNVFSVVGVLLLTEATYFVITSFARLASSRARLSTLGLPASGEGELHRRRGVFGRIKECVDEQAVIVLVKRQLHILLHTLMKTELYETHLHNCSASRIC